MLEKIEFQLYDWLEDNINDDEDGDINTMGEFVIHTFGRCIDGKSVYAKIINYTPYFYILLPDCIQNYDKETISKKVKNLELTLKENKKVYYKYKSTLKELQLLKLKCAEGFTNNKELYFARLVFSNSEGMTKYRYLLENNDYESPTIKEFHKHRFKLYEANLPPMLRCFHIRKIRGCDWISTDKYKKIKNDKKKSLCSIEIIVDWQNLNPIQKDFNAPLIIASFDLECYSHDGEFPQANRKNDAIIQIGITYTKLGDSVPYRKWIGCLDETDPIEGVIVESFETEQDMIESWIKEINDNDCDIITGYNIFHFDEKYLYDRCDKVLNMKSDIAYLSKLKDRYCNFKEMKLESSALGQNLMYYWETPGRVHIDLMKDIQKTFNFTTYKLDAMLANFIRGEVINYKTLDNNKFELTCISVDDIQLNDYIHIEVIKGFVSDELGEKYLVTSIDKDENLRAKHQKLVKIKRE
jgi:DNA polymerase elongation subunit (family B)